MEQSSISVFFPAYNDGGTIASMVLGAYKVLSEIADDYEVIVINDGSSDRTAEILEILKERFSNLRIETHPINLGYGTTIRKGISLSTKEYIFYTDGDAQYDIWELKDLFKNRDGCDIVNGYKIKRRDPFYRIVLGNLYNWLVKIVFGLKMKDVDCDFRLMKRSIFDKIELTSQSGVICVEMMKKIQDGGFIMKEVPVNHYYRSYGRSKFFNFPRIFRVMVGLLYLWYKLVFKKYLKNESN